MRCKFANETGGFWLNPDNEAGDKTGNNTHKFYDHLSLLEESSL
jgi:hypothetical protein